MKRAATGERRFTDTLIQRFDNIAVDLPVPSSANPAAAAAVQELMGGKFGEMSTLMNYTFQSFNFRGKPIAGTDRTHKPLESGRAACPLSARASRVL